MRYRLNEILSEEAKKSKELDILRNAIAAKKRGEGFLPLLLESLDL